MGSVTTISILLVASITHLICASKISPTCDMAQCEGYYNMILHTVKKPNIEVTKTKVKITEGPVKTEIGYAKRRWLTVYCYDGSVLDANTGCYETISDMNPTCQNAHIWLKEDKCPTGWECRPDGDCRGSSANSKCYDGQTMTTNVGPKTLKWEGSRWTVFAVHTCVSSWECNAFKTEVPVFAQWGNDSVLRWVFYDKDNREHELNDDVYYNGKRNPTGEILCPYEKKPTPIVSVEEAECYAENRENVKCIIKTTGKLNDLVFDVSKDGVGVLRNMMFEIVGSLLVPEKGRIIDLNEGKVPGMNVVTNRLIDRQRSVNVETAHELAISANVLQMQSLYNILTLSQEVDEIYNIIVKIVKSQSIDDPILISKVMGLHRFASKWSNGEIFEKCNCMMEPVHPDSNCFEGKMYNYGSYVVADDSTKCFHIPPDTVQNVSLVNEKNLSVSFIKYLPPQTASSDSASWDALNDYRNKLMNDDRSSHSYENLEDKFNQLKDQIGIPNITKYFLYLTYGFSWFSAIYIVLTCKR